MISVVIPAYTAIKTISKVLQAIEIQQYSGLKEIIVVDDGSTDGMAECVKSFKNVKYIWQENSGPAAARNRGVTESQGDFILFTDSDCVPEVDWIERMIPHFDDREVAVVAGSYGIANPERLLARCIHKEILYRHWQRMTVYPKSFGSYNFCIRKNVFEEVGGFNESYPSASGEDNDLSYKILACGYKIYFERKSIVRHFHPDHLGKYLKEQFRHGFFRAKIYRAHPKMTIGDDYTFWKDISEPGLVLLFVISVVFSVFGSAPFVYACDFSLSFLLVLELFYAGMITKSFFETFFFGFVMFLRAFARTFGFVIGLPLFLFNNSAKKIK